MARERLQKILARAGVASRRAAEELIAEGRVTVNGTAATLGASADPETDRVEVDGRALTTPPTLAHLAVHKPAGMVSSARDERGRPSVLRLIPERPRRLWPAGRLDVDSEGLLLLTNDGEWANRVLHPRYGVEREYAVLIDSAPMPEAIRQLLEGIPLDEGPARLLGVGIAPPPEEVERSPTEWGVWLRVRLGEGRKREVRRLFAAVGHEVLRLVRTRVGSVTLAGLRVSEWRVLAPEEVAALAGRSDVREDSPQARTMVAIDGPAGAGKSTVGHALATAIGATFIDTGLMYRALALAAERAGVDPDDGDRLGRLAERITIEVEPPGADQPGRTETVLLDGEDVTERLRDREVNRLVSPISRHAQVRAAMLDVQRRAAQRASVVMVGRDIGTVVLPDADLKVFLTAPSRVRAARRAAEMGEPERVEEYLAEIEERDRRDSSRAASPLRIPPGALVLDTGELDVEACVSAIVARLSAKSQAR